jgi:hypothetical protein
VHFRMKLVWWRALESRGADGVVRAAPPHRVSHLRGPSAMGTSDAQTTRYINSLPKRHATSPPTPQATRQVTSRPKRQATSPTESSVSHGSIWNPQTKAVRTCESVASEPHKQRAKRNKQKRDTAERLRQTVPRLGWKNCLIFFRICGFILRVGGETVVGDVTLM